MQCKIGDNVNVVIDNSFAYGYTIPYSTTKTIAISGIVVETPKWMKSTTDITIHNSITKTYNYIPKHKIISIDGVKVVQPKKTRDEVHEVFSSKTGEKYIVTKNGLTKKWSCTCIGYNFHKKCRHVTRLIEKENEND